MVADHKTVTRLLKTARGQIDGILNMIEEDQYCLDISNQIMASQAVLRRANQVIIRAHLEGCVRAALESGQEENAKLKINEIISLMEKLSK